VTRPKSSRDQWNELVELGASADLDDVAEMSEADVDAELEKAGFDLAEENRAGKAEHDASVRAAPRPKVAKPARPSRPSLWFASPAAALVAVGMLLSIGETVATVGSGGHGDAATVDAGDAGVEGGEAGTRR